MSKKFKNKKELFKYLVENKEDLVEAKKQSIKEKDCFAISFTSEPLTKKVAVEKGLIKNEDQEIQEDALLVKAIINTTKIMDSHEDVHLDGIWDDFLKSPRASRIKHIQEHKSREFDKIISSGDDLKVSIETVTWKSLGFDYPGKTQALTFESVVRKSRNPYMYEQYKNGWVDNHSVGMFYIELDIAINDKDYPAHKEMYDKYIDQVVNKEEAEDKGYFWAIFKAGIREGSAVPDGSNFATPTTSIIDLSEKMKSDNKEDEEEKQEISKEEEYTGQILKWLKSK